MDLIIRPGKLSGSIDAIPSKSQAHRLLICAAFADKPTQLLCASTNRDIEATADCLRALGAKIVCNDTGYTVSPITDIPDHAVLNCCESGSTLRFMLPIAAALGVDATFQMEGRLPMRPLSPLWEELERMGCRLSRPDPSTIRCQEKLHSGEFIINGGVSSQFITGLLFAAALLDGESRIRITGKLESQPYIAMTQKAMQLFGVNSRDFCLTGGRGFRSPGTLTVEGDWSNGAFFLAAQALGNPVTVFNLDPTSAQGDRAVVNKLLDLNSHCTISAADIPDLVPILSIVAAVNHGAVFSHIQRLRLKESDRVKAVIAMIRALGGKAEATDDILTVWGTGLHGGIVDSFNDHRIAMSAAIASTVCPQPVTVLGAQCVQKSYPQFWEEFRRLGGHYEQYLR